MHCEEQLGMQLKMWPWNQDISTFDYFHVSANVIDNVENMIDIVRMLEVLIDINIGSIDPITS